MRFVHGMTVTRLRAPVTPDPYTGLNTKRDWAAASELEIPNAAVASTLTDERRTVDGVRAEAGMNLYCGDAGVDVKRHDRIRTPWGEVWTVEGDLVPWVNPFTGWVAGAAATVERVP